MLMWRLLLKDINLVSTHYVGYLYALVPSRYLTDTCVEMIRMACILCRLFDANEDNEKSASVDFLSGCIQRHSSRPMPWSIVFQSLLLLVVEHDETNERILVDLR